MNLNMDFGLVAVGSISPFADYFHLPPTNHRDNRMHCPICPTKSHKANADNIEANSYRQKCAKLLADSGVSKQCGWGPLEPGVECNTKIPGSVAFISQICLFSVFFSLFWCLFCFEMCVLSRVLSHFELTESGTIAWNRTQPMGCFFSPPKISSSEASRPQLKYGSASMRRFAFDNVHRFAFFSFGAFKSFNIFFHEFSSILINFIIWFSSCLFNSFKNLPSLSNSN